MALSKVWRKSMCASLTRPLSLIAFRGTTNAFNPFAAHDVKVKSIAISVKCIIDLCRCFHASPQLLGRKRQEDEGLIGFKTSKKGGSKGKFGKRVKDTKAPPTEAPYAPVKLMRTTFLKTVDIFEGMTVVELAKRSGESIATLQNIRVNVGEKVGSEFDSLCIDTAELIAMEIGVKVRRLHSYEGSEVRPRPPVVTVMGHVDHGKTSILDALRQTSVAAREAGGITQHLGAFVVGMKSGSSITFLDTPGHAAFSAMRARGAAVTDIVVLVVAADDGVMPQTLEAIAHATAANVPIVVAINKCDKSTANPERVKVQLASEGLGLEEIGGDIQVVEVSALTKMGLDKLEEALLLQAELMDLKARVDGAAQAYVVEAKIDKGRGPLATVIVKAGTLLSGQHVVVGVEWGKIRAIRDTTGELTCKATPATPVEIEGLKGLPMAGDDIVVVNSEERARMLSAGRKKKFEQDRIWKLNEANQTERKLAMVEVPVIVKADTQKTLRVVTDTLKSLNQQASSNKHEVFINIVHGDVGPISQSDVDLAIAFNACIAGVNVRDPFSDIIFAADQASIKINLITKQNSVKMVRDSIKKLGEEYRNAAESSETKPVRVELPIIVRADVQGTAEAVTDALRTLNSPQVYVNIVHAGVGAISDSDLDLAQGCDGCIVGFNIRTPSKDLILAAAQANVQIKLHRVIYHLLEDIGNLIVEKAPGTMETKVVGEAQVLSIFELKGRSKAKGPDVMIAGCRVMEGRVLKSSAMRLLRSGEVVFEGCCSSLKREQQDVETVGEGNECGLVLENCYEFKVGDIVQCLEQVNRKPKFISSESGAVRIEC